MPSRSLGACLWSGADDPSFACVAFWLHSVTAEVRVTGKMVSRCDW